MAYRYKAGNDSMVLTCLTHTLPRLYLLGLTSWLTATLTVSLTETSLKGP